MYKLTPLQKEIIKQNYEHWMSVDYITELLWYKFPWFKVKLKKNIKEYIKTELDQVLTGKNQSSSPSH